jgi:hypothetical protein
MGVNNMARAHEPSPTKPSAPAVLVLYIMGVGRSGSTVLDTVLGNHPQIESVGELTNLPRSGWMNNEYCACGRQGNVCPFWTNVRREWVQRTGADDVERYLALQAAFERFRRWPWLLRQQRTPLPQFLLYAQRTQALFEAIRVVSGKSIIVDSSKNPMRAFALSLIPGLNLRLIHLVRDGRGVVWSYMKAFRQDEKRGVQKDLAPVPVWQTSLGWCLQNAVAEFVLRQTGAVGTHIRYEDFVEQPQETLGRIGRISDIDFSSIATDLLHEKEMTVGHMIAGNRVRLSGTIRLRPDYDWKAQLSPSDRRTFWFLASPLARRYGYARD